MAKILVNRIDFHKNNQAGTFFVSDWIEIYIEDTLIADSPNIYNFETLGISAYRNGTLITSGPPISYSSLYVTEQGFDISFCLGTSQVKFRQYSTFPYATYYTNPDSVECGAAPTTCDLIIIGSPAVTEASNSTTANGAISINAFSSNPIEYNLNQDFVYGQGQSSGTFSGLLYGVYRVYVRDSKNCATSIYVDLPAASTYGAKYSLEYFDFAGFKTKVEILERDYVGAVADLTGTDDPVQIQLRGEGEDDKFTPIVATQLDLGIISITESQYIGLYTNDPNKYRMKYFKMIDSVSYELKLVTKLLPFLYSETYGAAPYPIQVTGSDGIAELSDYSLLQKDGIRFYGKMSLIKILAYCLSFTKLNLNIKVACNIYSLGMASTAADDPLDQAFIDTEVFYLKGEAKLNQVIHAILKPFGATLRQWDGYWNIVRVEEMKSSYDYRIFDVNGNYVSNGTVNPVLAIDYAENAGDTMFTGTPNLELRNGYGAITVNYKLGRKNNILNNGDFRLVSRYNEASGYNSVINIDGWAIFNAGYALKKRYEVISESNVALVLYNPDATLVGLGEAVLVSYDSYNVKMGTSNTLKITVRYKIENPFNVAVPYVRLRVRVQYGTLYLTDKGDWTPIENTISYFVNDFRKYNELEIIAQQPTTGTPVTGMPFNIKVYHAHAYYATHTIVSDIKTIDTTSIDSSSLLKGETTGENSYAATITGAPSGYIAGDAYLITFPIANTIAAVTLNINSQGPKDVKKDVSVALVAGDIAVAGTYLLLYDGALFHLKSAQSVSVGHRIEYRADQMYYYQLESLTETADDINIIKPNDYHLTANPVQWVLKAKKPLLSPQANFYIDFVRCQYQTNGTDPLDTLVRSIIGEKYNRLEREEELIIGSNTNTVTTEGGVYFDYARLMYGDLTGVNVITTNVLSSELLYAGWLRAEDNSPWEMWTRDGQTESDLLHMIYLKMITAQYNTSWRLLRCSLISKTKIMSPLNCYKEVNDNNRLYIPISGTLHDRQNTFELELLEIGSDGSTLGSSREHSSAFSSAFS